MVFLIHRLLFIACSFILFLVVIVIMNVDGLFRWLICWDRYLMIFVCSWKNIVDYYLFILCLAQSSLCHLMIWNSI